MNKSSVSETHGEKETGLAASASDLAHEAADKMMHVASNGASSVKRQVTDALDKQVASGADMISRVASSTRRAAEDLEREVPQLAGMIRTVADKVDTYADDMKERSIEDLIRSASDFTRRQPAAVFGFAALAGFLVFRALKTASENGGDGDFRRYSAEGNRSADFGSRDTTGRAMGDRQTASPNVGGSGEFFS